jgi:hypothetical protein
MAQGIGCRVITHSVWRATSTMSAPRTIRTRSHGFMSETPLGHQHRRPHYDTYLGHTNSTTTVLRTPTSTSAKTSQRVSRRESGIGASP